MVVMTGAGAWSATLRSLAMLPTRWKRGALLLIALWGLVTYIVISPLKCAVNESENSVDVEALEARLRSTNAQLERLRHQHSVLIAQVKASKLSGNLKDLDNIEEIDGGPSEEYETLRRRVYSNTKELLYYISHELGSVIKEPNTERLESLLEQVNDRVVVLLADQQKLWAVDGYADWRKREAGDVNALVQRRLRALQHPHDCKAARKVVCNLNKGCGFGCQVHHIAYCLIFAYATERTLVLKSRGWRYNSKGWDQVFMPLSDNCTETWDEHALQWPARDSKVVSLPFIDSMSSRPKFLPLAIPKDLAKRVVRFNGDPAAWWISQTMRYILRPRPALAAELNKTAARMRYKPHTVGVHIRRTDKVGTEAAFHHIHEYMRHVKQHWRLQDLVTGSTVPRRVYLASDDPNVIIDARKSYPEVEFIGDPEISRTAATHRRYTPSSLTGLLVDLTLLGRSDHLVCTFSSQVGRVAYELMQANRPDASDSVFSLDDIYYFGGQNAHDRIAELPHTPENAEEIELKKGDLIGVAGNHWNGYGRGFNRRTNQNGLWPWYKTADHLVLYPFPTYDKVPLKESNSEVHTPAADLANLALSTQRDNGL